jgi:hypothetical protein
MRTRLIGYFASLAVCAALLASAHVASAQYLKHPDPRIPRTADGKPDLNAPAPRLPDGRPDLSGIRNAADGRFLTNIARRAGFDAPFQPAGALLFKERQETEGRDRPAGRCLPHTVPTAMMVPNYPWKVVQTPNLMVVLFENFTRARADVVRLLDRQMGGRHVRRAGDRLQRQGLARRWRASAKRRDAHH